MGSRKNRSTRKNNRGAAQHASGAVEDDEKVVGPTPEQETRASYIKRQHTTEMGLQVGFGYRRRALFETMAESGNSISRDELSALRFYRSAFDRCDRSPTRSCLAVGNGGRSNTGSVPSVMLDTPAVVEARRKVRFCEAALGSTLSTMRAVALDDQSFSQIAMDRYGTAKRGGTTKQIPIMHKGKPVIVGGKPAVRVVYRETIRPRSGAHREIIRQEFAVGLKMLADRVRSLVSTPGVEEIWVQPEAKGATIKRGACAPNGLYRMWGGSGAVDEVLRDLRIEHGDTLSFPSAPAAKAALDAAAGVRLNRLDEEELRA